MQFRDRIKEFRRVKGSQLVPHPKNWRTHPKSQANAFLALLKELGCASALIVRPLPDGRYMVIDGHMRLELTPDAEFPVLVLDVSEEEAEKLLLIFNPLAAMAEADTERLKALLETVQSDSEAVQDLLRRTAGRELWEILHPDELNEVEIAPDRAEELRLKWGVETGQLWQTGPNRLLCGDSRERPNLLRLLHDTAAIQLIVTDAPYGIDYFAKNEFLNRSDRGHRIQKPIANDDLSPDGVKALFETSLREALAFAARGAACYATVPSGSLLPYFIAAFEASGLSFKHFLVWLKQHFVIGMSDYQNRFEGVLYGWVEDGPHYFIDDRTQSSVFEVDRPMVSDLHPTTKPIGLFSRMIANSSRTGEIVYDPFSGSGTAILAAQQLGRVGYGVEIDPGYVAVTLERLSMLGLNPELVS
jgi:DNA modification methylase